MSAVRFGNVLSNDLTRRLSLPQASQMTNTKVKRFGKYGRKKERNRTEQPLIPREIVGDQNGLDHPDMDPMRPAPAPIHKVQETQDRLDQGPQGRYCTYLCWA